MELEKLKTIWDGYDEKLDETLEINRELLTALKLEKVKSKLRKFVLLRIVELVFTVWAVSFLWDFAADHISLIQFVLPAAVLMIFFILGIAGIVRQFVAIGMIDYSEPVIEIQKKLVLLESHVLMVIRVALLSLPFYMAYIIIGAEYFFGTDIVTSADSGWLTAQLIFSLLLIPAALWLYFKLSYKNIEKPYLRKFLDYSAGSQLGNSLKLMKEIDEFEKK
ncbi:MAG: hypothetical protein JSS91_00045 [Bacteroidetes bacterium]|nr:hypothetical protein [Bacteroidota bacterium]